MASSSTAISSKAPDDRAIQIEANDFIKELEVERILRAFKLNPYDILNVAFDATENDIRKQYRKTSLLIHPDKFHHPRGVEAFDLLKKASQSLTDETTKSETDILIIHARTRLLKEFTNPPPPLPVSEMEDSHPWLQSLKEPMWRERVLKEVRELMIGEELARRKAIKNALANEGLEAKKKEEEISARKRKLEEEKTWEENRDSRISDWRSFNNKKSKKKKSNVLG